MQPVLISAGKAALKHAPSRRLAPRGADPIARNVGTAAVHRRPSPAKALAENIFANEPLK
jgi:hypothetical protein